jgi:hypothetical protein
MRWVYLVLAVLGAVLPYSQFVPFLAEHGLDLSVFFEQLFATRISAFFGLDVIVSALAVLVFIAASRATLGGGRAVACGVATLGIGPSCGLPLLLFFLTASDGRVEVPSEKG